LHFRPTRQHLLRVGFLLLGRSWTKEVAMANDAVQETVVKKSGWELSLDWWAVLLALVLALLVRVGWLQHISW
jgi:hypothetical protein